MSIDALVHFPFYVGDYMSETMSFTQAQRGAYTDIKAAYIVNDGILPDDERLFIMTRCFSEEERTNVSTVVERAFKRENGFIVSEKLNLLISKQKGLRQQRIDAGKKSAEKRAEKQRALQQSESEPESESEPKKEPSKISLDDFEYFWERYGKIGNRQQAIKSFNKAVKGGTDYATIIRGLDRYQTYCREIGQEQRFIKHASTWLNNRGWEDDYTVHRQAPEKSKSQRAREAALRGLMS